MTGFTPLATLLDQVAVDPAHRFERDSFIATVRRNVTTFGLVRRPATVAALRADPAFKMKYREKPAHRPHLDDAGWERFALSLGDCDIARKFSVFLPALAAAIRIEPDAALLQHVREQLAELATWSPLMRPGWSGGSPCDGAWLGTGWAVRAIVWTLNLLPPDSLPPALHNKLDALLRSEVAAIREDWRTGRNWYIRDEAVYSNQWALPLEAVILACAHLGLDAHRDDFDFAVTNLLRTLDAQGRDGEFVEGMEYAAITLHSVYSAARAAAEAGDLRLLSHPYLSAFPLWYLHHRQPAGQVVNAFDNLSTELDRELLSRGVTDVNHPGAAWVLARRPYPPTDLYSLAALPLLTALGRPPTLFATYPVAARVNWLESHDAFADAPANRVSGFWMRGGHPADAHDHQDRGHVNFIVRGRPVLIEAGHASYGLPEHPTHFRGVAGHNVLQLTPQLRCSAPLAIERLDASGGVVEMDGSQCHADVARWLRRVEWDASVATIHDEIALSAPEIIAFRWHLGAPADAPVETIPSGLRIAGIELVGESLDDTPIVLTVEPMPDRTLQSDRIAFHASVVVKTTAPALALKLRTRAGLIRTNPQERACTR